MIQVGMESDRIIVTTDCTPPSAIQLRELWDYIRRVLEQGHSAHISIRDIWRVAQAQEVEVRISAANSHVVYGEHRIPFPSRWIITAENIDDAIAVVVPGSRIIIMPSDQEEKWRGEGNRTLLYSSGRCRVYYEEK